MKKIAIMLSILPVLLTAQVAIGKDKISSPSVSLEFYDGADNQQGMILPWVTKDSDVAGAVNGTLVFDTNDHKIKVKLASGWKDLSVDVSGKADTSIQDALKDNYTAKVSIGTPTATPGILVLEDANKAMVLPKVASPHLTIVNPSPGMMAYDTVAKQVAFFNGTVWSFWKP